MRRLILLSLLLARPAAADSALDYVEHIFGATNVNAVGGHGALTVGVSADGDLTVLSWPGPGFADQLAYLDSNDVHARELPHLGAPDGMGSYFGLLVTVDGASRLSWLRDASQWTAAQTYSQPDAPVPVTTFTSASLGLTVTLTDIVSPDVDVLTRRVQVERAAASPVSEAQLVVYENLSPSLSRVPQLPIADWGLEAHNDFLAVWDEASQGILHFHPGDREVFASLVQLVNLNADVNFGPVEALLAGPPGADAVDAFVAALDTSYEPGVAALVTSEPAPASYQVGNDATLICPQIDTMVDNVLALPALFPTVTLPISPDTADLLRCSDQLPALADTHGWAWRPEDALADLADGALSGSPVAAAQTNGALVVPLGFQGDAAEASVLIAFGATRAEARAALAAAQAQPAAARQAAAEQAAHEALAGAPLPDPALGDRVVAVARRALVNLYVARDRQTGAFLASVTRQPPYYLDWPRDGAFLSLAADIAGRKDWVSQRHEWYAGLIRDSFDPGSPALQPAVPIDPDNGRPLFPQWAWEMNYYTNGEPGGTIRFEIDNTALHVWSTAEHAARLTGDERRTYLDAVWPNDKHALDLLVRWKEADSDLPALANEDDNPNLTSTLHGAVTVYAGLVAGARLAHAVGDDVSAEIYLQRAQALRAAIDANYWDAETMRLRAARGEAGGPEDSIGGWSTGWAVWPARFFADDDPRREVQLAADMDGILEILHGERPPGGTYTAKNVLAAALYGRADGARAQAAEAVALLAGIASPGVDAFGEVYVVERGPNGELLWSNRTAMPHVWEGALFYLSAMALTDASLFNADETLALPGETGGGGGCGCRVGAGGGGMGGLVLFLLGLLRARCPRRPAGDT